MQRWLLDYAPRQLQSFGGDLAVFFGAQVIEVELGRDRAIGALNGDAAATGGVEIADAGSEGVECVQGLAEGVEAQRLHVVLQIGVRSIRGCCGQRRRSCEGAELIGPRRPQRYCKPMLGFVEQAASAGVESGRAFDFVNWADLQMILQIGADSR